MTATTVRFYVGNEYNFEISDVCLRLMGKSEHNIINTSCNLLLTEDDVTHISFENMYHPSCKYHKDLIPIIQSMLDLLPFMRAVMSSAESIAKGKPCVFNTADYTQNEVMHAMFWIRAMMTSYSSQSHGFKSDLGSGIVPVLHEIYKQDSSIPLHKALIIALCPSYAYVNIRHKIRCRGNYRNYYSGDANLFNYDLSSLGIFLGLLTGNWVGRYHGGTLSENWRGKVIYPANISMLCKPEYMDNVLSVSEFYYKICNLVHTSVIQGDGFDLFGGRMSGMKQTNMSTGIWISAIDEVMEELC